jgi:hypothetical protein
MSRQPRRGRRAGVTRCFTRRRVVAALVVFVLAAAGVAAGKTVLVVLAAALLVAAALSAARTLVRWRRVSKSELLGPWTTNPPIKEVAADLRRLLWQHDAAIGSGKVTGAERRVWGLEAAITRRATQGARALGVPHATPPDHRGLDRSDLRLLLRALAAEGLALPPTAGLMVPDSRR